MKWFLHWFEMTPTLPDDRGKVPKPNGVVDGSIPGHEIFSLLDKIQPGAQAPPVFPKKKLGSSPAKVLGYGLSGRELQAWMTK